MTKLNDTQLMLLSTAAQRDNGSVIPLPTNLTAPADKVRKAISAMIKSGVAEEGEVQDAALAWRSDGDIYFGVRITEAGRIAIGLEDAGSAQGGTPQTAEHQPAPAKQTKVGLVLEMLQREQGAALDELVAATGWLPHTTRAALTGLRKRGHEIEKSKRGDATCYRVAVKA